MPRKPATGPKKPYKRKLKPRVKLTPDELSALSQALTRGNVDEVATFLPDRKPKQVHISRDPERDNVFFGLMAIAYSITDAAHGAGYSTASIYTWRLQDTAFRERWEEALRAGDDYIEQVARGRAVEGWLEPVYQGGAKVGEVRKFDSQLLQRLLAGRKPQYGNNSNVNISGGMTLDVREVPDAALNRRLVSLLMKAGLSLEIAETFKIPELPGPVVDVDGAPAAEDDGADKGGGP